MTRGETKRERRHWIALKENEGEAQSAEANQVVARVCSNYNHFYAVPKKNTIKYKTRS